MRPFPLLLLLSASVGGAGCGRSAPRPDRPEPVRAGIVVAGVGFREPVSVLYDADGDEYLVANANGSQFAADDNGFISRVGPDGVLRELAWIDGARPDVTLNAPNGMALLEGKLYVADLGVVRVFDRATGAPLEPIPIDGASSLDDVVAFDGAVYVTDSGVRPGDIRLLPTGSDAVYRIDPGAGARRVAWGRSLHNPAGVAADIDGLWVVSFGAGELYLLVGGKKQRSYHLPAAELDGLVLLPSGMFLVSSWRGRTVFLGPPFERALPDVEMPGDIDYDPGRSRLLVPLRFEDALWIYPLPAGQ